MKKSTTELESRIGAFRMEIGRWERKLKKATSPTAEARYSRKISELCEMSHRLQMQLLNSVNKI